jgi:hypothetical protein
MLSLMVLGFIGFLEIIAAGVVYRILVQRSFFLRTHDKKFL